MSYGHIESTAAMDIGRALQRAWRIFSGNLLVFGLLTIGAGFALGLLQLAMTFGVLAPLGRQSGAEPSDGATVLVMLVSLTCTLLLFAFTQALAAHGAVCLLENRKATFASSWSTGLRNVLPVAGVALLLSIMIMIGWVLLVIPGVIVAVLFALAIPAVTVDQTGVFGAFGRSLKITQNNRFALFGYLIVGNIAVGLLIFGMVMVGGLLMMGPVLASGLRGSGDLSTPSMVVFMVIMTLVYTIGFTVVALAAAAVPAGAYAELKAIRDGGSKSLENIFS